MNKISLIVVLIFCSVFVGSITQIPKAEWVDFYNTLFYGTSPNQDLWLPEPIAKNGDKNISSNFKIEDGKVIPKTILTPEQLKIQKEQGCVACHDKL